MYMRIIDRYLDDWISRKALAVLRHSLAMCGYHMVSEKKSDYYDISIRRYNRKDEKLKYFFTLNVEDGLEFYLKWKDWAYEDLNTYCKELLNNE